MRYQGNISCKDEYEDRNGKDLKEAEKIKKNQQEYMEELYKKKGLMTWMTKIVWSLTLNQTSCSMKSSGP